MIVGIFLWVVSVRILILMMVVILNANSVNLLAKTALEHLSVHLVCMIREKEPNASVNLGSMMMELIFVNLVMGQNAYNV